MALPRGATRCRTPWRIFRTRKGLLTTSPRLCPVLAARSCGRPATAIFDAQTRRPSIFEKLGENTVDGTMVGVAADGELQGVWFRLFRRGFRLREAERLPCLDPGTSKQGYSPSLSIVDYGIEFGSPTRGTAEHYCGGPRGRGPARCSRDGFAQGEERRR